MKINRRDFLKWSVAASVALKMNLDFDAINTVLAAETDPPVIWLQGSGCSGCSVSTLNVTSPTTIENVLLNKISMKYNNTVMASYGESAMSALEDAAQKYNKQFYLVVEGAIPTAENGKCCVIGELNGVPLTMLDAVKKYAPMAKAVVAAGTCAAFGGVSAAAPNETGSMSVKDVLALYSISALVVNLPACPVHPTVLIETLVSVILGNIPTLNPDNNTPTTFYTSKTIHEGCPRNGATKVTQPGVFGCYMNIGCNGPTSNMITCRTTKWNNGVNWCIDTANTPCIGCANSDFPTNPLTY